METLFKEDERLAPVKGEKCHYLFSYIEMIIQTRGKL